MMAHSSFVGKNRFFWHKDTRTSSLVRRMSRPVLFTKAVTKDASTGDLLHVAQEAAKAGAEVVLNAVDKPRRISFKGVTDLVTDTDQASEDATLAVIRDAFPGHAILGEEGGVSGDTKSEYLWCVDPLDGTTNFAHGYPSFAVCVACLQFGRPVASTVVEFSGGPGTWVTRTYTASKDGGAFLNGTPIKVSDTHDVQRSLLVTGFGYEHDEAWEANLRLFRHFTDVTQGVRRLGSAAIDMCHVASGIADGYWEFRLKPWDMAAGVLIVEEAGGQVTRMDGGPFTVFDRSVVVSNGHLHTDLLHQMKPVVSDLIERGVNFEKWFLPDGYRIDS